MTKYTIKKWNKVEKSQWTKYLILEFSPPEFVALAAFTEFIFDFLCENSFLNNKHNPIIH